MARELPSVLVTFTVAQIDAHLFRNCCPPRFSLTRTAVTPDSDTLMHAGALGAFLRLAVAGLRTIWFYRHDVLRAIKL